MVAITTAMDPQVVLVGQHAAALSASLDACGLACTAVATAQDALTYIATARPRFVVLASDLPDMSGLDLVDVVLGESGDAVVVYLAPLDTQDVHRLEETGRVTVFPADVHGGVIGEHLRARFQGPAMSSAASSFPGGSMRETTANALFIEDLFMDVVPSEDPPQPASDDEEQTEAILRRRGPSGSDKRLGGQTRDADTDGLHARIRELEARCANAEARASALEEEVMRAAAAQRPDDHAAETAMLRDELDRVRGQLADLSVSDTQLRAERDAASAQLARSVGEVTRLVAENARLIEALEKGATAEALSSIRGEDASTSRAKLRELAELLRSVEPFSWGLQQATSFFGEKNIDGALEHLRALRLLEKTLERMRLQAERLV